jgi:hypothetical protein
MSRKVGLPSVDERLRAEEIAEAASRKASPKKRTSSPAKRASSPAKSLRAEANAGTKLRGANADTHVVATSSASAETSTSPADESNMDIADDDFDADAADTPVVAEASAPAVLHPFTAFPRTSSVAASLADEGIVIIAKSSTFYIYQLKQMQASTSSQQPNINENGHGITLRGGTGMIPTFDQPRGPKQGANAITIQLKLGKGLPHVAVYSERSKRGFKIGKN